jgi:hypothetical protein
MISWGGPCALGLDWKSSVRLGGPWPASVIRLPEVSLGHYLVDCHMVRVSGVEACCPAHC